MKKLVVLALVLVLTGPGCTNGDDPIVAPVALPTPLSFCGAVNGLLAADDALAQLLDRSFERFDPVATEWSFRISDLRTAAQADSGFDSERRVSVHLWTRELDGIDPRPTDAAQPSEAQGDAAIELIAFVEAQCDLVWPEVSVLRAVGRLGSR